MQYHAFLGCSQASSCLTYYLLPLHVSGDLDCCLDILISLTQRLRDSEDVSKEQLASAAKRVTNSLTKEVIHLYRQCSHLKRQGCVL